MSAGDEGSLRTFHLLAVPVALWARAQEHTDELLREFALIAESDRQGTSSAHTVPRRLLALVDELSATYGGMAGPQEAKLAHAAAAGETAIDLTYQLPAAVAGASAHLGELLDEADEYCRSGEHLLTLATPEPLVAFRRWFLDEFIQQAAGRPPTPWPATVSA